MNTDRKKLVIRATWATALLLLTTAGAFAQAPVVEDVQPNVHILYPNLNPYSATRVPTTFNVTIEANDPDDPTTRPAKIRMLFVPGLDREGVWIQTRTAYYLNRDELVRWDDPLWSEWLDYPAEGDGVDLTFPDLPAGNTYVLAAQAMDRDGAVSTGRDYGVEVMNLIVSEMFYPQVALSEYFLGTAANTNPQNQIAAGQPLNFSWTASADAYNGEIVSCQHGWNVTDPDDPFDPGWEVPPGVAPENFFAAERVFDAGGLNSFYLKVIDDSGNQILYRWLLDVVPFVPYADQDPLLLIDQVIDDSTGRWPSETGVALDGENYRNAYWRFLAEAGGVQNFDWNLDRYDHTEALQIDYEDVVRYRAVLCIARVQTNQYLLADFRAVNGVDPYVWLHPYQERGGNFFLAGDQSLDSFIEVKNNYWVPTIFDTAEPPVMGYETSFGFTELPNGDVVKRGPRLYHYATVGISALDWSTTGRKTIYSRFEKANRDRTVDCAGIKGMTLDPQFKMQHLIGPGVLADTFYTDRDIDWMDYADEVSGTLDLVSDGFTFLGDEFVNANISPRTTPFYEQQCAEGPGGLCIEPMYRGIARFDYVRELRWSQGDAGWPYNAYVEPELQDLCGPMALAPYDTLPSGTALTNGQTFGFLSYKMAADKESGKADVYWGFDPYRFDRHDTQQAILWVMEYFGLELD